MKPTLFTQLLVLAAVFASGCSLSVTEQTDCTRHAECRDAFGLGTICGEDGLCAVSEGNVRCTDSVPAGAYGRLDEYSDAVLIGALFNHKTDEPNTQSATLAMQQVRAQGDLDGKEFVMLQCSYELNEVFDDLEIPEAAAETATYLTDELGVQIFVGPATSDSAQAVYEATADLGALAISPSATSIELTEIDGFESTDEDPGLFWRTVVTDDVQASVIAGDLLDRGIEDISIVFQDGSYGSGLADLVGNAFESGGGKTVTRHSYALRTEISGVSITAGADASTEVLFFSSEVLDIAFFVKAVSANASYDDKTIFLADGAADVEMLAETSNSKDVYPRVRGTRPGIPSSDVYNLFKIDYKAAFDDDADQSIFTAFTYDATWLALYGAAWSYHQQGEVTGLGAAKGLRKVSGAELADNPTPLRPENFAAVLGRFEAGQDVNLQGASGDLDFDPDTGEVNGSVEIWTIVDPDGDESYEFLAVQLCEPPDLACTDL
jgi:ABC-type branched-subunit amino acid transport system substrate-binding protein